MEAEWRFDVIAVDFAGTEARLAHNPNALEAEPNLDRRP
jgi:hypothetical protein